MRRDPDPVHRGRRATELLTLYQQRATELARLRRAAVEEAHRDRDMSYTEIAAAFGITKGRVTQIRSTAPAAERAFFGVGPVNVGVPYRYQVTDRERPLIAAEDAQTADELVALLDGLVLTSSRFQIEPDRTELPTGDAVVVCGPKSAPISRTLLDHDPALAMVELDERWWIEERGGIRRYGSPDDEPDTSHGDIAYLARHVDGDRVIVHIAGIHAIGSLGAAHYLASNLPDLYATCGDASFSTIVRCTYDGVTITDSERITDPYVW